MGTATSRDQAVGRAVLPGGTPHPTLAPAGDPIHRDPTHCDSSSGHFSCSMSLWGGEEAPVGTRGALGAGQET